MNCTRNCFNDNSILLIGDAGEVVFYFYSIELKIEFDRNDVSIKIDIYRHT